MDSDWQTLIFFNKCLISTLSQALEYLVKISEVDETEIFKICLEYWNSLAAELYRENPFGQSVAITNNETPTRRHIYLPILTKVIKILADTN